MFDGRHCTYRDYDLLVVETEKVLTSLYNKEKDKIDEFIKLISRFDINIAKDLSREIKMAGDDYQKIAGIITHYTDELKQNVLVDIREHQ